MAKIQKNTAPLLPVSDWYMFPWNKELFAKHENDFKEIKKEYDELKSKNGDDPRMARWLWLEKKGALKIKDRNSIEPDIHANEHKYEFYSNMFSRFLDYTAFNNRMTMTPEQRAEAIAEIKGDIPKVSFEIPKDVFDAAKKDLEDDLIMDALNNF